jgi:hypothetical protein
MDNKAKKKRKKEEDEEDIEYLGRHDGKAVREFCIEK